MVLSGFKHAMLLVNVATPYCWIYGLPALTLSDIVSAFDTFSAEADGLPCKLHSDFD